MNRVVCVRLLKLRSHGVPTWCDQLLQEMVYNGKIVVIPRKEKQDYFPNGNAEAAVKPEKQQKTRRLSIGNDDGGIALSEQVSRVLLLLQDLAHPVKV